MRTTAPGLEQPIQEERPEPPKAKKGEELCNCKLHPKWYCDQWPRCVAL